MITEHNSFGKYSGKTIFKNKWKAINSDLLIIVFIVLAAAHIINNEPKWVEWSNEVKLFAIIET